jgi:hypothetical protein
MDATAYERNVMKYLIVCFVLVCGLLIGRVVMAQGNPAGIAIQPVTPPTGSVTQFAPAANGEAGRYQITVVSDGARGTVVMLLDTKEGATWIYRPPQGNAVNGFWSDIPRLTYAPEFWRNVFNQQQQPTGPAVPTPAAKP